MAFNSTLPVDHSPIVAAELRAQFNGLNDLLTAQQNRWAALATQLADITPLNMTISDPPTVNEVQSLVNQMDAILTAIKAA